MLNSVLSRSGVALTVGLAMAAGSAVAVLAQTPPPAGPRPRGTPGSGGTSAQMWTDMSQPTLLQTQSLGDGDRVRVTWNDTTTGELRFRIFRERQVGRKWTNLTVMHTDANATEYVDSPGPGVFRYRVAAVRLTRENPFTQWSTVTVNPFTPPPPPPAPGNVSASHSGQRRVVVTWVDNSQDETGFEVFRDPPFAAGSVMVNPNVTMYVDSAGAGTFSYRVRARGPFQPSPLVASLAVTVQDNSPLPPDGLAVAALDAETAQVSWSDNADNEAGYDVERQTLFGQVWGRGVTLARTAPNTTVVSDQPGPGRHRYRVRAANGAGASDETSWAEVSIETGWTQFAASADSRVVYVSSSTGNDANDGLSESRPVRTLGRGYALLRNRMPDWMLLRRGDTWTNEVLGPTLTVGSPVWEKSGRSAAEPMLVGAYGSSTQRPVIQTGPSDGIFMMGGDDTRDHFAIVGIEFYAQTRDPASPSFISGSGGTTTGRAGIRRYKDGVNFLIEDCAFRFLGNGINFDSGGANGMQDMRVRRCVIVDSYGVGFHSQGIWANRVDGLLIEENVLDHCGWNPSITGAGATIYNHNAYIMADSNRNVVLRRNISARASATGLQCRPGGIVTENLLLRNPTSISMGHAQVTWPAFRPSGEITNNVLLEGADIANSSRGRGMNLERVGAVRVANNVIAHLGNAVAGPSSVAAIRTDLEHEDLIIENNVIYAWDLAGAGTAMSFNGSLGRRLTIRANQVQQVDGGLLGVVINPTTSEYTFAGNRWHSGSPAAQWFRIGSTQINFGTWTGSTGEAGAVTEQITYPDPNRTVSSYMQSMNMTASLEAFLAEARRQSKANWRPQFTAAPVIGYVREGFGLQ